MEAPADEEALVEVVRAAHARGERVKVAGAGHSFSAIGRPEEVLVSPGKMRGLSRVDHTSKRITARAGTRIYELNELLATEGLALANLGDIDRQTVAGAIATGTHGTGLWHGGLAAQVAALDVILGDGSRVSCSATERPGLFAAARVGLGAMGVLVGITVQCVDAFALHAVEGPRRLDEVLERLDDLVKANDHFEFYWFPHTDTALTKANNRVPVVDVRPQAGRRIRGFLDDEVLSNGLFGVMNRLGSLVPATVPSLNRVAARFVPQREYVERSYRVFTSPRRVHFKEMEYAVPIDAARHALAEIRRWIDRTSEPISIPLEVRFSGPDDIWMSTAFGRTTAYIAVHQYWRSEHRRFFDAAESILWNAGGRPHWGKMHTRSAAQLRTVYPRFDDFLALRREVDPAGMFSNAYLDRVLGPA